MKDNKHLSIEERSKISILQSSDESVRSIARILGRSPSTISRELNRPQVDKFIENYIATTDNGKEFSKHEKTKYLIQKVIFVSHITVGRKER